MENNSQNIVTQNFIRVFNLLKEAGYIKSNRSFCNQIDYHATSLTEVLKGRRDITLEVIRKMRTLYDLDIDILFDEEPGLNIDNIFSKSTENVPVINGDMTGDNLGTNEKYRKSPHKKNSKYDKNVDKFVREEILRDSLSTIMDEKPIEINNDEIDQIEELVMMLKRTSLIRTLNDVSFVPYYDIGATSGVDFFFKDLPEDPDYYLLLPYNLNDCIAIPVYGRSMEPEYHAGDILIIRELKNTRIIEWGAPHVVITNEQRFFKIINQALHPDEITLASYKSGFQPMVLKVDQVEKLYKVEALISKKCM